MQEGCCHPTSEERSSTLQKHQHPDTENKTDSHPLSCPGPDAATLPNAVTRLWELPQRPAVRPDLPTRIRRGVSALKFLD